MIKKILLLLMFLPVYLLAWKMESGKTTLPATTVGSSTWQTVTLQQSYDSVPLIFAMPDEGSGYSGDTPAALRVRNIGLNSFEVVQVEPQPDDGAHASMTIHYIAIEPGNHTLHDGTRFLARSEVDVLDNWQTVNFSPAFTHSPVMLAMMQSMNNENDTLLPGQASVPWMVAGLRSIGTNSFETFLDKVKTAGTISNNETVGYLAISGSSASSMSGSFDSTNKQCIQYETKLTPNSVNGWGDECYVQGLNTYSDTPNVIASMQTRSGGDGGWVRRCSISSSSVGVTIDEDNTNRTHGVNETVGLAVFSKDFIFDSAKYNNSCIVDPLVDYRMDECYWLNGSGGVIGDVKDTSSNAKDATSSGVASIIENTGNPPMCNYGNFTAQPDQVATEDGSVGNSSGGVSISVWLKPSSMTNWQAVVTKSKAYNWDDGWGLVHYSGDASNEIRFFVNNYGNNITTALTLDQWNHVIATYDNQNLRIYVDGVESLPAVSYVASITNSAMTDPIRVAYDDPGDDEYIGGVDELKIWDKVLTSAEINDIYNNEKAGINYDGAPRSCSACGAQAQANIWNLVGVPADLRTATNKDVADVFEEFPSGSYNLPAAADGWVLFKRTYDSVTNAADYAIVPHTGEPLSFGQGYWLISNQEIGWSENGLPNVDYNSTNPLCPSTQCVEIDMTVTNKDFSVDANDGTGPNRNNMLGFVGNAPVEWADCRIDINGISYTPTDADTAGYANKQIWQYNPGAIGANSNGYTTCDDALTTCKLEPYKGFWVQLYGKTKGSTVKLLIPRSK